MIRGLMKSASATALALVAFASTAAAADLGGNCCADLEERVAELEATAVKKGNRKVSVQIYGWVNKTIMAWDAPVRGTEATRGTYLGLDNTNSATRFGIRGNAGINSEWKAGYSILLDVFTGGTTARASRASEDGGNVAGSTSTFDDHLVRMRDANVWLESTRLGRVSLGRLTGAGAVAVIDLGGVGTVASGGVSLVGNALTFANGRTLGNATDQLADFGYRQDGVRWDSPALQGFTFSASTGETSRGNATGAAGPAVDGNIYGVAMRYAGEFNGVRLAAGLGYERARDDSSTLANVDAVNMGGSLALLHVGSGLFIQGDYLQMERNLPGETTREGERWLVQAGLKRNFFGIGDTVLYGEAGRHSNMAQLFAHTGNAPTLAAGTASQASLWGLGVVQNIDAAAMELYAGYRKHSYTEAGLSQGDIGIFLAGARINF